MSTPAPVAARRQLLHFEGGDGAYGLIDTLAHRWLSESLSYSFEFQPFVFTSSSTLVARVPSLSDNVTLTGDAFEAIDTTRRGLMGTAAEQVTSVPLRLNSNRMGGAGTGTEALHVHAGSIWYSVGAYVSNIWSPGVYGVQERLWSSGTRGVLSLFYDPISRAVVAYTHTSWLSEDNIDIHVSFLSSLGANDYDYLSSDWSELASGDYILVVTTDSNYKQYFSDTLTSALEECGGSSLMNTLPSYNGDWHAFPYILVGQCGKGLSAGWSAARGLEIAGGSEWSQLDLEVRDLAMACGVKGCFGLFNVE